MAIALERLLELLNNQFLNHYHTEIRGGYSEPFYKASVARQKALIQFSHDYIRSALHELAHWCVAGKVRREHDDFGYWYAPDGRSQQQQNEFFQVEIKPQALEWAFSIVAGVRFEASMDNLNNSVAGADDFEKNVLNQLECFLEKGFSNRADQIIRLIANDRQIEDVYSFMRDHINNLS